MYLPALVFPYDQLYVAISKIRSSSDLKIIVLDHESKSTNSTLNVVYNKVFDNIK